jgi:deoxyribodipyrimidine photolyase-related protein
MSGLLLPGEVCDAVEEAYRSGAVPIASAEGFIRQVIGWREYVWGLYWLWMPEWRSMNALAAERPIPPAFLGRGTQMRCVTEAVDGIEQRAWVHHIQRLVVLGNSPCSPACRRRRWPGGWPRSSSTVPSG